MTDTESRSGASMLLSFKARNVRSFRDDFELSLLSTAVSEPHVVRQIGWRIGGSSLGVLPAACVFGANATGKTGVLRAMADMQNVVRRSFQLWDSAGGVHRHAFRLDDESAAAPSLFEVDLVLHGIRHVYGFEIDDKQVTSEWAFRYTHGRKVEMFTRDLQRVKFGDSMPKKSATLRDLLRPNALLLSTAAATGHRSLAPLAEWFGRNFWLAESGNAGSRRMHTTRMVENEKYGEQVIALMQAADLGVVGARRTEALTGETEEDLSVRVQTQPVSDDATSESAARGTSSKRKTRIQLEHQGARDTVFFDMHEESLGTIVWLGLAGPVLEALAKGTVLLADEIDASLHSAIVYQIIRLFQSPITNPLGAQLIFNSHDPLLLGEYDGGRLIGRDQIWFTEKDRDGSSRLFALSDLGPRKHEAVDRRYLAGRYGAVPIVSGTEFASAAKPKSSEDL